MSSDNLQQRSRHLLSMAKTIRYYEEALSRANGESFNLFDVLHVGHYEVRTHSPLLAELLNPKGSHGQGTVFLRHFLAGLKIQGFDTESARVLTEVSIGELGRLDIEIADRSNRRVMIENKIYAGEQEDQLERYHIHDPNAHLLFLTLNGDFPTEWSTNKVYQTNQFKGIFQTVSYKTDIVRWLEACRKEAATAPGVREAITQYIHLIQRLTQQNTSERMNHELIKAVLESKESFLSFIALRNADKEVRAAIIASFNEKLRVMGNDLGLQLEQPLTGQGQRYDAFWFSSAALASNGLQIEFECQKSEYRDFCFGFSFVDRERGSPATKRVQELFKLEFGAFETNIAWATWLWWDQHGNWNDDTFASIQFGTFAEDLNQLLKRLVRIANLAFPKNPTAVTT
jgi:hypothetical protein